MTALTIAICTKDRLADLDRCIGAIARCALPAGAVEVLIVDDGVTPSAHVADFEQRVRSWGGAFRYHKKDRDFGLYRSRRLSVALATGAVILFIDDDVELEPDYLERLLPHYVALEVAGVGGVDILVRPPGIVRSAYERVFLLSARSPGRLTQSGFNWSIAHWGDANSAFVSEFLSGCNMSFRRAALQGLEDHEWLDGYSLGEDIVVSLHASQQGQLIVDPQLRVRHHVSRANRLNEAARARSTIRNHHEIRRLIRGERLGARIAGLWSGLGMFLSSAVHAKGREALAIARATLDTTRRDGGV
jgi:glycosyltransferase involved in cell wall biosynthesis